MLLESSEVEVADCSEAEVVDCSEAEDLGLMGRRSPARRGSMVRVRLPQ